MARVVRLTEQELTGLLKDILGLMSGNKDMKNDVKPITSNKVVGSGWKSCKAWRTKGGASGWGDKIKVDKGSSQLSNI